MNSLEKKVKKCYESEPFPNTLQKSTNFNETLDKLIYWLKLNFKFIGLNINWEPRNILCAGCGTGEEAIELSKIFPKSEILGIDISASSLTIARKNKKKAQVKNIILKRMSILEDLPNLNKRYDLIFSAGVIHHLQDPEKGFSILADKLTDDGKMIIALYNTYGLVFYKIKLFILDILAGKNFKKRKEWALRLKFHDGKNRTILFDSFVNPQVKTYAIETIMNWAKKKSLLLKATVPPLSFPLSLQFALEGKKYIISRKKMVSFIINISKLIKKKRVKFYKQPKISYPRVIIFQMLIFLLLGKGECYFLLEKNRI